MIDIPDGMSYAALGALFVAISGWLILHMAKRSVQRGKKEGELDDRVVRMIEAVTKPLNEHIASQRVELDSSRQERAKVSSDFIDYVKSQQVFHDQALERVRTENHDALQRMHDRLNVSEAKHAACDVRLEAANQRINNLEAREANRPAPVIVHNAAQTPVAVPAAVS